MSKLRLLFLGLSPPILGRDLVFATVLDYSAFGSPKFYVACAVGEDYRIVIKHLLASSGWARNRDPCMRRRAWNRRLRRLRITRSDDGRTEYDPDGIRENPSESGGSGTLFRSLRVGFFSVEWGVHRWSGRMAD